MILYVKGHVVYIDHFGNVVTNISKRQFINLLKEDLRDHNED
jgi:S-adenosylmethionine hydrolase